MSLGYECRKCGAVKKPDGKGCSCGESYGSLKVVRIKDSIKIQKKEDWEG